jgi:dipicolinate synthase subunit B
MGLLLNTRGIYFVPYRQDNFAEKSTSIVSDMSLITKAAMLALESKQMQPVMLDPH